MRLAITWRRRNLCEEADRGIGGFKRRSVCGTIGIRRLSLVTLRKEASRPFSSWAKRFCLRDRTANCTQYKIAVVIEASAFRRDRCASPKRHSPAGITRGHTTLTTESFAV